MRGAVMPTIPEGFPCQPMLLRTLLPPQSCIHPMPVTFRTRQPNLHRMLAPPALGGLQGIGRRHVQPLHPASPTA